MENLLMGMNTLIFNKQKVINTIKENLTILTKKKDLLWKTMNVQTSSVSYSIESLNYDEIKRKMEEMQVFLEYIEFSTINEIYIPLALDQFKLFQIP